MVICMACPQLVLRLAMVCMQAAILLGAVAAPARECVRPSNLLAAVQPLLWEISYHPVRL